MIIMIINDDDNYVEGYYIYKSIDTHSWHLFPSLDDSDSIAFCTEQDVMDCSGKWFFYINQHWEQEITSVVTMCDSNDDDDGDDNIIYVNPYGNQVYVCNDDALWEEGISIFTFDGYSNNGYPYFISNSILNINTIYYLHHVYYLSGSSIYGNIYVQEWVISKNNIQDIVGVAHCQSGNLNDCVAGHWQIHDVQSEFGDQVVYVTSESMRICTF